ncbi:uncharacterized protein NECHADRAFT_85863 [Fusarium vanettenii 77-13-4]|uniref:Uncharacterized protein n=1 Tax=Fusarium vanettenii (strain ATCC MYA-4622 / CBS 123669 / FGSC 9596 / NRRL 45880 / 77-13-4) TaxID=660122 RepID=C7Z1N8_FUSV7|nr:uncharacterized protein NECHADRAFT_85863 [Fusarium vanettenii 77-13-4]EEU41857.1 predicted protein [Fusarium vanettenii 77-13-4]
MSRRNNRRARSSKPTNRTPESQLTIPKSPKQIKKQKRRSRREAKRNQAQNRMREQTVDSDGDIDAISESDAESEQDTQRRNTRQEKMDLDRAGPFDLQRLRTAVTSIIKECVEEFGVANMNDYMDWQPEPPTPVYLVLLNEMPCYPAERVHRY